MYNTTDPVPRTQGKPKKPKGEAFKNYAEGSSAIVAGYSALRVARQADKLGEAADAWKKVAKPSQWFKTAPKPKPLGRVARAWRAGRKIFNLRARISELRFASGDIFRKYSPDSTWNTHPLARKLSTAATARRGLAPTAKDNFSRKLMRDAIVAANEGGEHTEYLQKATALENEIKSAKKKGVTLPPMRIDAPRARMVSNLTVGERIKVGGEVKKVKPGSMVESDKLVTPREALMDLKRKYRRQIDPTSPKSKTRSEMSKKINTARTHVRQSMADELMLNRSIIQGERRHAGTLPKPLTGDVAARTFLHKGHPDTLPKRGYLPKPWKTGPTLMPIGGKLFTKDEYKEDLPKIKEELKGRVSEEADRRLRSANNMHAKLTKRAEDYFQRNRIAAQRPALGRGELRKKTGDLLRGIYGKVEPDKTQSENISSALGLRHPGFVGQLRDIHQKLARYSQTSKGEQMLARDIASSGKIFKPEPPPIREAFPRLTKVPGFKTLRKLFKFSALGDAVTGTYVKASSAIDRIEANFRRHGRKLARKYPVAGAAARGYAKGWMQPLPGVPEALAATHAGAAIAKKIPAVREAGVRRVMRRVENKKPIRMSAIHFQDPNKKPIDPTTWHDAAIGGIEGLGSYYTTDALVKRAGLTGWKKAGVTGIVGGLGTAVAGFGLNRLIRQKVRKRRAAQDTGPVPGDSPGSSDSLSSKLKLIRFDDPYGFKRPAKPPTRTAVVQDRYRKAIREKEINRHESNVLRSTIAGAALGGALRHTPKAAGIGALVGAGAEAATIASQRSKRDVFGDSTISTRRIERLPYQAAGLAASGIIARKLLKRFSRNGHTIRFERKKKSFYERAVDNPARASEVLYQNIRRTQRTVHDLRLPKTGGVGGNVIDERGRERKPEWKKPWAVKGLATLGIAAAIGRKPLWHAARAGTTMAAATGLNIARKIPGFGSRYLKSKKNIKGFVGEVREAKNKIVEQTNKALPSQAKKVDQAEKARKATEADEAIKSKLKGILKEGGELKSKLRTIHFAEVVPDWRTSDARGKSVRVYAPGSQKRERRPKAWHEKKSNRDFVAKLLIGASLPTGGVATALGHSWLTRNRDLKVKPAGRFGRNVAGVVEKDIAPIARKTWRSRWV